MREDKSLNSLFLIPNSRSGFTLIELLLFAAIFVVLSIGLVSILVSFTGVQLRQGAVAEVSQQSQFLSQTIQRYIEESSWIDITADTPTDNLKLRTAATAVDPTNIYLDNGVVYIRETDGGTPRALTSNKVTVSQLTFTKRTNTPGKDYVSFTYTVSYNTTNPRQQFSQSLTTAIARVNAATFDSDLVPPVGVTNLNVGVSGQKWQTINGVINFSGTNVGIGAPGPTRELEVEGGLRLNTTDGIPSCGAADRGTVWFTQNTNATDTIQTCIRNADNSYVWSTLAGGGGSATSSVSGSGSSGFVAKWTGTNSLGTSVIADDGTNVGIGDSSPLALLTVGSGDLFRVTSAGLALHPAGAVGAPSLSFTADTNTGIWSSGADTLNFSTGGSERLTISGANVGVASSSPGAIFAVGNSFRVDASGNVASGVWQGTAVGATKGGTGTTTVATGNLLYGSAADTWGRLAIGANGNCLVVTSGLPAWGSCGSGGTPGGASGSVQFASSTTFGGDTNLFWDDASNRLGIGTNGPDMSLTVAGDANIRDGNGFVIGHTAQLTVNSIAHELQFLGTAGADSTMLFGRFDATAGNAPGVDFYRSKNASIGSATVVASADALGAITWRGAQQTGTFSNTNPAAQIAAFVDGTVTSGAGADMPGRLVFYTTADGSGTLTERMRIGSGGVSSILATDGSSGAPPYAFTGSSNTGMYRQNSPAALILTVAGSDKAYFPSSVGSLGLEVLSTGAGSGYLCTSSSGGGSGLQAMSVNTSCTASDARLKTGIVPIALQTDVLSALDKLHGVYFYWDKNNPDNANQPITRQLGMVAQDVQKVLPELVSDKNDNGYLNIDYPKFTGFLLEVAKVQQAQISSLANGIVTGIKELWVKGDIIAEGFRKTYYAIANYHLPLTNFAGWGSRVITISPDTDGSITPSFAGNGAQAAEQSKVDLEETGSGNYLATYGVDSTRKEIQLSGSSRLIKGEAKVFFDYSFTSIISDEVPLRVLITPTTGTIKGQMYVAEKTVYGFVVKELNGGSDGEFDWLVIARTAR